MAAKRFQDIVAWQLARELRRTLARLVVKPSVRRDLGFCTQVRKAARSVTANIAEGFPCTHAEFARFLDISARSLREIEDRLIEAVGDRMLTVAEAEPALLLKKRAAVATSRFTAYLRTTPDPPNFKPRPPRRRAGR
jgi:four helix bundle protein